MIRFLLEKELHRAESPTINSVWQRHTKRYARTYFKPQQEAVFFQLKNCIFAFCNTKYWILLNKK